MRLPEELPDESQTHGDQVQIAVLARKHGDLRGQGIERALEGFDLFRTALLDPAHFFALFPLRFFSLFHCRGRVLFCFRSHPQADLQRLELFVELFELVIEQGVDTRHHGCVNHAGHFVVGGHDAIAVNHAVVAHHVAAVASGQAESIDVGRKSKPTRTPSFAAIGGVGDERTTTGASE